MDGAVWEEVKILLDFYPVIMADKLVALSAAALRNKVG